MTRDISEEWFFQSIQRYDQLFMYELERNDGDSSFKLGLSPKGLRWGVLRLNTDIKVYAIPLRLSPSSNRLPKRDSEVVSSVSLPSASDFVFLSEEDIVISHSENVSIWKIQSDSDLLLEVCSISVQSLIGIRSFGDLRFLCIEKNKVRALGEKTTQELVFESDHTIIDACCENDILSVLTSDGRLSIKNIKKSDKLDVLGSIPRDAFDSNAALLSPRFAWSPSYTAKRKYSFISFKDDVIISDIEEANDLTDARMSPDKEYISFIAGCRVMVFKLDSIEKKKSLIASFDHDGHDFTVMSHEWHPIIQNTIFSIDKVMNVHIWTFKE